MRAPVRRWIILDARDHIEELQSLRGIAALIVAISHLSSIYLLPPGLRITIDSVCNAHACVIVFFVLSGYVLTGSLVRRGLSWSSVKAFYIGRLFRLFPALWVASAISALFLLLCPQLTIRPPLSFWFFLFLHPFPSLTQLILAALAIDKSLIMPVWTIFIELMGSAIMPVMVALARARLLSWIVLGMALAAYLLAHAPHRLDSLSYMFDFALGVWLASRRWQFFGGRSLPTLLGSVFTLIFFRFAYFAIRNGHPTPLFFGYDDPAPMLVEGLAAFFLVGALASEHGRIRALRSRWAISLGNTSYSLYLIHFPVAILLAKILTRVFTNETNAVVATAVLMAAGLTISLGLASVIYRFIELPSIALGKRVSKQLVSSRAPMNV
jgi:peptidoglycan/LPS O-acetylase OafA/YrhL